LNCERGSGKRKKDSWGLGPELGRGEREGKRAVLLKKAGIKSKVRPTGEGGLEE